MSSPVAIYVHTPFCPSKCGYCDFNSYAMEGEIVDRTVDAIERQIRETPWRGRPAKTIFFGGGTPTFLSADQLTRLLAAAMEVHPPIPGAEISSEANPGTVDVPKFEAMVAAGFERISLGAQSFQTGDLIQLGRVHAPDHIARAVGAARRAGFQSLNLDLMFALPGQSARAWRHNLDTALALRPDHLSLYGLTIEPNTRYYRHHLKGMLDLPDEDRQIEMYEIAVATCERAGYRQYEISNFAKPGHESRHNLCYWRAEEYLGYGPGAVGCFDRDGVRTRYTNLKHPRGYSEAVEGGKDLWCEVETLDDEQRRFERVMLGIRLNEGLEVEDLDEAVLARHERHGWIERFGSKVKLTPLGRHLCSQVAIELG